MYKKKYSSLTILIPVYNEKKNFQELILSIKKRFNVLVIDDCSTDGTFNFLKKKKIKFVRNKKNLGYERSLIKGFSIIKKSKKTKYILTMDGDGQHNPKFIENLYNYSIRNNLDVVVGERCEKNRLIEKLISTIFSIKYNLHDPLSGFKIYKNEKILDINLIKVKKFFLVDFLIFLIEKKVRIRNLKIKTNPRIDKPRIGNSFSTYLKMIKILFYVLTR